MSQSTEGHSHRDPSEQLSVLLALHGVLAERYIATNSLQWQIPVLGLAAESFLIAANASSSALAVQAALSLAIFAVGLGSLVVMRRVEVSAFLDRPMLDHLEQMLIGDAPIPRLMHAARANAREIAFRDSLGNEAVDEMVTPSRSRPIQWFNSLAIKSGASRLWSALQGLVTLVGVAVPALQHL